MTQVHQNELEFSTSYTGILDVSHEKKPGHYSYKWGYDLFPVSQVVRPFIDVYRGCISIHN